MPKSKSVHRPDEDIWYDDIELPVLPETEKIELKPIFDKKIASIIEKLSESSDPKKRALLRKKLKKL